MEKVSERVIVDGGHNPDGAAALFAAVKEFCPGEKFTVVFAAFEDKSIEETMRLLCSDVAKEFVFTSLGKSSAKN